MISMQQFFWWTGLVLAVLSLGFSMFLRWYAWRLTKRHAGEPWAPRYVQDFRTRSEEFMVASVGCIAIMVYVTP